MSNEATVAEGWYREVEVQCPDEARLLAFCDARRESPSEVWQIPQKGIWGWGTVYRQGPGTHGGRACVAGSRCRGQVGSPIPESLGAILFTVFPGRRDASMPVTAVTSMLCILYLHGRSLRPRPTSRSSPSHAPRAGAPAAAASSTTSPP